jgi:hypothetical protein
MSRRAFNPTAEQRGNVEAMIGYGIPAERRPAVHSLQVEVAPDQHVGVLHA